MTMLALGSRSGKLGSQKHGLFGWSLAAAVWLNLVHFSLQSVCVCVILVTPRLGSLWCLTSSYLLYIFKFQLVKLFSLSLSLSLSL